MAVELVWNSVGETVLVSPIASSDRHDAELGHCNRASDGVSHLRRAASAQADVAV